MSPTANSPRVSVPVLSNTIVSIDARRSSATEPFTTTPARASQAIAAITALGVARINGHGQATTSTLSAGKYPADHEPLAIRQPINVNTAVPSTTGKNQRARRSAVRSSEALRAVAWPTISTICASVVC